MKMKLKGHKPHMSVGGMEMHHDPSPHAAKIVKSAMTEAGKSGYGKDTNVHQDDFSNVGNNLGRP